MGTSGYRLYQTSKPQISDEVRQKLGSLADWIGKKFTITLSDNIGMIGPDGISYPDGNSQGFFTVDEEGKISLSNNQNKLLVIKRNKKADERIPMLKKTIFNVEIADLDIATQPVKPPTNTPLGPVGGKPDYYYNWSIEDGILTATNNGESYRILGIDSTTRSIIATNENSSVIAYHFSLVLLHSLIVFNCF